MKGEMISTALLIFFTILIVIVAVVVIFMLLFSGSGDSGGLFADIGKGLSNIFGLG